MNTDDWKKINELFHQTVELPAVEREILLKGEDEFVRSEVNGLIASHESANQFIAESAIVDLGLTGKSLVGSNVGNYKLLEMIGSGGMGTVFRAEKEGIGKNFAIKLIKRGMDTDAILRRFHLERQILSRLEHPNIARLLDGGTTDDGLPFFVMEYVEGLPIAWYCDKRNYDTKARLELFRQVCSAVQHAHQNLIVHRDLKPSNILVTDEGIPKLLDFGIAKLLNPEDIESTATHARMFTPEYASPEQLSGLPITTASDVFSLGVVLYELLSGQRPFTSNQKNYQEIVNLVLTEEPIRPSSVVSSKPKAQNRKSKAGTFANDVRETAGKKNDSEPKFRNPKSLRGDLDNIILKSLRKEPDRRYQSVQEFSEDVRRQLAGLPVTATADSSFYRFSKFVKRHRRPVLFAAITSLLLTAITAFSTQQFFYARQERIKAETRADLMRNVVRSLLNETSAKLKSLPEGLEIRQSIIENSAAILDSLSDDIDDTEFLSELGDAYQQLGHTRNWHLRQHQEALENLQKARNLHERINEIEPNNPRYMEKLVLTLGALSELYSINGNIEAQIETYKAISETYARGIELEPANPGFFYGMSTNLFSMSETLNGLGKTAERDKALNESLETVDRAIDLQQNLEPTIENQTQLVFYYSHQGLLFERANKPDQAILRYENAAEIADRNYSNDITQMLSFNQSVRLRRMMADVYRSKGDWHKSLKMYELCLQKLLQNRGNKSLDEKTITNGISIYLMRIGVAQYKTGDKKAGIKTLETGLNQYLATLKRFENYAADILYSPEFLIVASDFYVENNQKRKAIDLWQKELLQRVEKMLQTTQDDSGMLIVSADCNLRNGDILSGFQNDKSDFTETSSADLKEALEYYENAQNRISKVVSLEQSNRSFNQRLDAVELRIALLRRKLALS